NQRNDRSPVQHFQHTKKKSQGKISVGGPRAEAHVPYAAPPPGVCRRECDLIPARRHVVTCSPVAFNDSKHLARSMPADGLEAQDVVPPRCGCWVAHKPSICRHFHMRGPVVVRLLLARAYWSRKSSFVCAFVMDRR